MTGTNSMPEAVRALVGLPYEQADCYALVRMAQQAMGLALLPELPETLLAMTAAGTSPWRHTQTQELRLGDLVEMLGEPTDRPGWVGHGGAHLGIIVDARPAPAPVVLHARRGGGAALVRLDVLVAAKRVRAVWRQV